MLVSYSIRMIDKAVGDKKNQPYGLRLTKPYSALFLTDLE